MVISDWAPILATVAAVAIPGVAGVLFKKYAQKKVLRLDIEILDALKADTTNHAKVKTHVDAEIAKIYAKGMGPIGCIPPVYIYGSAIVALAFLVDLIYAHVVYHPGYVPPRILSGDLTGFGFFAVNSVFWFFMFRD